MTSLPLGARTFRKYARISECEQFKYLTITSLPLSTKNFRKYAIISE